MARTSRNMMIERADKFRTLAQVRRNRGLHTGKSAPGWNWTRPDAAAGSWGAIVEIANDGWRSAVLMARNDFAAAVLNGPGWEDDLADFV